MSAMPVTIYRRHTSTCPHTSREVFKCKCPLWADGYKDGKRFRQSLGTRDMARAGKRAAALEEDPRVRKSLKAAVQAFTEHCISQGLKDSTQRKYRNILAKLTAFCNVRRIDSADELTIDVLDAFRASRKIAPITQSKELELLRGFCGFCSDRKWCAENYARKIKGPRNLQPNDVIPYTPAEIQMILAACDAKGYTAYEKLRARAMMLALRYTALRIGDVAMLRRDSISHDGKRWRIFLRTSKTGTPVFLGIPQELKTALDCVPLPKGATADCPYYFCTGAGREKTVKANADVTVRAIFKRSGVQKAHAHRFRHTLATELLGAGASFEEVADILGNTPEICRKHYGKWSLKRQARIDDLMDRVHVGAPSVAREMIQ